jgi:hypothetical protein
MSVYYFELTKITEKNNKFGMATNSFWQNTSGNSYNTLVNYVIYGDDGVSSTSKGHYAFGQLFIQPNNAQNQQPYPPKFIINDQKKEGITNIYTQYNETGTAYLLIDTPVTDSKYFMKCTVI